MLEKINSPQDLKDLDKKQLEELSIKTCVAENNATEEE